MYEPYKQYLSSLHGTGQYRKLTSFRQDGSKRWIDFSSNDYLGLSRHKEVLAAGIDAAQQYGMGATGSRLLSGNLTLMECLETQIASDKRQEAALIFSTGFQANLSVLAALLDGKVLGERPIVFFDRLNHASLYQAVFLSTPELVRYHHHDMEHLAALLDRYSNHKRPKFIVTETVFGMDGDVLPIQTVLQLAKQHDAFLYLDEAHATGLFGPLGYGLSTTVDWTGVKGKVVMGTFSKALGCSGGYIACDRVIRDYLINRASGFIYSTAPSPAVVGAAAKAWQLIGKLKLEREWLKVLGDRARQKLSVAGFNIGDSTTHIVPILLGEEQLALEAKEALLQAGVLVSCIRPPTVPPRSARLRIAFNASHRASDVDHLVDALSGWASC